MRYFDSSIFLKLYLKEPNSVQATVLVRQVNLLPLLTAFHRLEMRTAIGQKLRRGEIGQEERDSVLANFAYDVKNGLFNLVHPHWSQVFSEAEGLAERYASSNFCRSLDTLHVALALTLGAAEFCTFDKRQAEMARVAGLRIVLPP